MRTRGFTLVELAIVLVILALLGATLISMSSTMLNVQRGENTKAKLQVIDAAIVSFVAINRRLPCPANGALNVGLEVFNTQSTPCANQVAGVVPWAALGLAATDIEDAWGTRITYRIDQYLARTNALDMSQCDPAGTMPAPYRNDAPNAPTRVTCGTAGLCLASALTQCVAPTDFLAGKGLEIRDSVNPGANILMNPAANPSTGAAYILISHGANRSGGYDNTGGLIVGPVIEAEGPNETQNRGDTSNPFYVDATQQFSNLLTYFDDFVLRPSIISVVQRAHLGPRSH